MKLSVKYIVIIVLFFLISHNGKFLTISNNADLKIEEGIQEILRKNDFLAEKLNLSRFFELPHTKIFVD